MKNFNSTKLLLILSILFSSYFIQAQSVTIEPSKTTNQSNSGGENINVVANSPSLGIYGRRFNGTFASKTPILSGNELFRVSSGGWYTNISESQNAAMKFIATENWNVSGSGSKIAFTTTPNATAFQIERMVIDHNGRIGIGLVSPQSKLHVHEATSDFIQAMQITSDGTGSTATDGLGFTLFSSSDLFVPRAARIMNNENGQLILGANNLNTIRITPEGNVGINSIIGTSARFQINHDTGNDPTKPHINLITNVDANNGMVKMSNFFNNKYFGQYFNLNSTAANNFISFDYNGNTPILDLKGNGNVQVAGFTKLGGATAPSIKMVTLTNITDGAEGGNSSFPHNLIASKIINYEVLVEVDGGGVWVKQNHTFFNERQFDTEINNVNVRVYNHGTNRGEILSNPIKVVITYIE